MKIYVGHSRKIDYINELYNPIINSKSLKKHEFIFPHITNETFNSQEVIEQSDLFIADISISSLPLGIEIGRAEIKNKKILCICNENAEIPSSLKYVNVDILVYKNKEDMLKKIELYIKEKC